MVGSENGSNGPGRRFQYSPTVTLGNLLTIVVIAGGAISVYATSLSRLAVIEERTQQIPELRKSVDAVKEKFEDLGRRVEVLWDRKNSQSVMREPQ